MQVQFIYDDVIFHLSLIATFFPKNGGLDSAELVAGRLKHSRSDHKKTDNFLAMTPRRQDY